MELDFGILGQLEARRDGGLIALGSPRQRALLARLLICPNEVVTTDRLIEDLWADDPPDTARHTLHVYISRLRTALGEERSRLQKDGLGYRLSVGSGELDAERFGKLAAEGRAALSRQDPETAGNRLREALAIWRGPALADVADESFAREAALQLEELRQNALEHRVSADLELGCHSEVLEELQKLVIQHPFRETLWEQLMLALYRAGRQTEALRAYQTVRSKLADELGLEPGPALRGMEERILTHDRSLLHASEGTSPHLPIGLPLQRTSFIGREREVAKGERLLEGSRLLTLTGAPGSGKTRLALRLATDRAAEYADGTFFVPLAPLARPGLFDTAVARVLGLREVPGESALDGVKAFFARRQTLLVLDNFEHILGAARQVGELIDSAPDLTIMVTSRSPLGIAGEQEFPVPPLEVPPEADLLPIAKLVDYDAVALFVARAQAADPDFELGEENAASVAAITIRLDGLPLAIELAAARIRVLTPQNLRVHLERRLALLTEGPTDIDERHRTMRDAIAWSYELLEPPEGDLFRKLAVFVGGFTLEAVSAVAGLPETRALDMVGSLLSRSLIYRPVDVGRARFSMLEMTREFALEELASAGNELEVADRHARYFLSLAQEIEPELTRDPSGPGAQRLAPEVANIRAALRYFLEVGRPDLGLNLASSVWRFWQSSDQLIEGREWLVSLLEHSGSSDEARAKGLTALAGLAYWLADYEEALRRYETALALYRAGGDRLNEADTLYGMSLTAGWQGDLDTADRLADEARLIFEDLGSKEGVGRALIAQAFVLWKRSELPAAKEMWEQALAIVRECGDQALANTAMVGLASLTFQLGNRSEAVRVILEGVEEASQAHNAHITVWMLDFVAAFAAQTAPEESVRLAGAVDSLRREAGGGILPESLGVEDARSVAGRIMSPERIHQAWARVEE